MKLLTWWRIITLARLFGRAGFGLKFFKIFRAWTQNAFMTLRVTTFFFRDVDLLCSPG